MLPLTRSVPVSYLLAYIVIATDLNSYVRENADRNRFREEKEFENIMNVAGVLRILTILHLSMHGLLNDCLISLHFI